MRKWFRYIVYIFFFKVKSSIWGERTKRDSLREREGGREAKKGIGYSPAFNWRQHIDDVICLYIYCLLIILVVIPYCIQKPQLLYRKYVKTSKFWICIVYVHQPRKSLYIWHIADDFITTESLPLEMVKVSRCVGVRCLWTWNIFNFNFWFYYNKKTREIRCKVAVLPRHYPPIVGRWNKEATVTLKNCQTISWQSIRTRL